MASPTLTDEELTLKFGRRFTDEEIKRGGIVIFDKPYELGYSCPKGHCSIEITWSEFKEHIWCYKCDLDYPSKDCPIKRPCWMNKKLWDDMYGNHPEFNVHKGRIHPDPDCKKEGKFHRCVK